MWALSLLLLLSYWASASPSDQTALRTSTLQSNERHGLLESSNATRGLTSSVACDFGSNEFVVAFATQWSLTVVSLRNEQRPVASWAGAYSALTCSQGTLVGVRDQRELVANLPLSPQGLVPLSWYPGGGVLSALASELAAPLSQLFAIENGTHIVRLTSAGTQMYLRSPQKAVSASEPGFAMAGKTIAPLQPEASTLAPTALSVTINRYLFFTEAGAVPRLRYLVFGPADEPESIVPVNTLVGSDAVIDPTDGPFLVATFSALGGIRAFDESTLVFSDSSTTRMVVASCVVTSAGTSAIGFRDGLSDATFGGSMPQLAAFGDYTLVTDVANDAVRLQQMVNLSHQPQPTAVDESVRWLGLAFSSGMEVENTNLFVALDRARWVAARRTSGALSFADPAKGTDVATRPLPVSCSIHGVAWSAEAGRVFLACYDQHSLLQVDVESQTFDWWCGMSGVPDLVDGICGDLNGARFRQPAGLAGNQGSFVVDHGNHAVRHVAAASRRVQTFAGNGTRGRLDGAQGSSTLWFPREAAWDCGSRLLYVSEATEETRASIRVVDPDRGTVATVVSHLSPVMVPGEINSIAVNAGSIIFVANGQLFMVYRGAPHSGVLQIAQSASAEAVGAAHLDSRCGNGSTFRLLHSARGNVSLFAIRNASVSQVPQRWISFSGKTSTAMWRHDSQPTWGSRLDTAPQNLTAAATCWGTESLVTSDAFGIRFWSRHRAVTTVVSRLRLDSLHCDESGATFGVSTTQHLLVRVHESWGSALLDPTISEVYGVKGLPGTNAPFLSSPSHVSTHDGTAWVSEPRHHRILAVRVFARSRSVLAGNDTLPGLHDGPVANATLSTPTAITIDVPSNSLFFFDGTLLRQVHMAVGVVRTVAGKFDTHTQQDGSLAIATFRAPRSLHFSSTLGTLVIADSSTVRKIVLAGTASPTVSTVLVSDRNVTTALLGADGTVYTVWDNAVNASVESTRRPTQTLSSWGSFCVYADPRDATRGSPGALGDVAALTQRSLDFASLIALERDGSLRELGHASAVRTLPVDKTQFDHPVSIAYDAARDAFLVVNWARHNVVQVDPTGTGTRVVSGSAVAPFEAGHDFGNGKVTRWTGPVQVIAAGGEFAVVEREGNRGRRLDASFASSPLFGDTSGRPGNEDGTLAVARVTMPRVLARRDRDGHLFVGQHDRIRVVSPWTVSTITPPLAVVGFPGVADGPTAVLRDVRFVSLWLGVLLVVDGNVTRTVDLVSGVTRTLSDSVATNSGPVALSEGAVFAMINDTVLHARGCVVQEAVPDMEVSPLRWKQFAFVSPSSSRTSTLSVTAGTNTSEPSVTASRSNSLAASSSASDNETLTSSLTRPTPSTSISRATGVKLVSLNGLSTAEIRSPKSSPTDRTVTMVLLGTQFNLANSSASDWYQQVFRSLQFDVEEVQESEEYGVAERRLSLLTEDMVQSVNETHLEFVLGHDPLFFVHVDQQVTVTTLGPLLADRSRTATGDFVITSGVQPVVGEFVSQSATIAAFSGAGLGSLVALSPSLAAFGPRVVFLHRMRTCSFRTEEPQQVFVNPVGASFGDGDYSFHRGTLTVNPALILGGFAVHFVVADYVRYYSRQPRRRAMGQVLFPSLSIVTTAFFLQSTVTAAMVVVAGDENIAWRVAASCVIAAAAGLVVSAMGYFALGFKSVYTTAESVTGRARPCVAFVFLGAGWWEDHPQLTPSESHHTRMACAVFNEFRGKREWFGLWYLIASIAAAWAESRSGSGNCTEASIALLALASVELVLLVLLRPFASPLATILSLFGGIAQLVAVSFIAASKIDPTPHHADLADAGEVISVSLLYAIGGAGAIAMLAAFGTCLYTRKLRIADRTRDQADNEEDLLVAPTARFPRGPFSAAGAAPDPFDSLPYDSKPSRAGSYGGDDDFLSGAMDKIGRERRGREAEARMPSSSTRRGNPLAPLPPPPRQGTAVEPPPAMSKEEYSRLVALL